jgi:VIT1/CCC1 family predicted Fe2+/Mn2+ transporter
VTREDVSEAIFGSFDGVVSVIGVIVALLAGPTAIMVDAAIGLAAASAVGMAAGEYLGDHTRNLRKAGVMGVATIVGTMCPVVPFIVLPKRPAIVVSVLLVVAISLVIARSRAEGSSARAYVETFGVLLFAAGITALVSWLTGSSAA